MSFSLQVQPNSQPAGPEPEDAARRFFEAAGGEEAFFRLVTTFYEGVAKDPILRPMYPEDLSESIRPTALFLIQYCGGPDTYSQEKGHPRLRMRHAGFSIGQAERDAWVKHMRAAVEAEISHPGVKQFLLDYFEKTATFMMNRKENPATLKIGP